MWVYLVLIPMHNTYLHKRFHLLGISIFWKCLTGMRVPPWKPGIPGKNIFKISKIYFRFKSSKTSKLGGRGDEGNLSQYLQLKSNGPICKRYFNVRGLRYKIVIHIIYFSYYWTPIISVLKIMHHLKLPQITSIHV